MEKIPFDLEEFKNGAICINAIASNYKFEQYHVNRDLYEIKCVDESRSTSLEVNETELRDFLSMKPKEEMDGNQRMTATEVIERQTSEPLLKSKPRLLFANELLSFNYTEHERTIKSNGVVHDIQLRWK